MDIHIRLSIDDRLVRGARRVISRRTALVVTFVSLSLLPAVAGSVDVPYEFTAGTPVRASEMNKNFDKLEDSVDSIAAVVGLLSQRVGAVETKASANSSAVSGLGTRMTQAESSSRTFDRRTTENLASIRSLQGARTVDLTNCTLTG